MGAPLIYPNELWVALRELWEATPKISMRELRDQVGAMMACECPSEQAIYARKSRDGWKKKPLKKRKSNAVEKLLEDDVDLQQIPNKQNDCAAMDCAENTNSEKPPRRKPELLVYPVDPTPVLEEARRIMSTVDKIVWKHRTRAARAGQLFDSLYSSMEQLSEACARPDVDDPEIESKLEKRHRLLGSIDAEIKMLTNLMTANQIQQKMEREAWGIESSGDDGEVEKRKADVALLEDKTKSARSGLAQQKAALAERLRAVESGEIFEHQPDGGGH